MAEGNNSDDYMDYENETSPSTELAVATQETETYVEESQEKTNNGVVMSKKTIQLHKGSSMHMQNHAPLVKDCNFTNSTGVTIALSAGGTGQGHEEMAKQSDQIQQLGQQVKRVASKVDTVGKRMNEAAQQHESQTKDLAHQVKIVGDEVKNIKRDQVIGTDHLSSLLQRQLKVAEETKHQVESLKDPTEVQTKVNEEVSSLRAAIEEAMATLHGKLNVLSSSQQKTNRKMETTSAEAERNRTQLQMNQAQQQQVLSTIVSTQYQLQSLVEQVERVQARVEHSEDQMKDAVRQLGSQKGGGSKVPLSPRFRKNLGTLKDHMKRFDEVVIYLYQQFAITDDDVEELKETKSRDKIKCLVEFLNLENDGFRKLMDALNNTDQKALVDAMKD